MNNKNHTKSQGKPQGIQDALPKLVDDWEKAGEFPFYCPEDGLLLQPSGPGTSAEGRPYDILHECANGHTWHIGRTNEQLLLLTQVELEEEDEEGPEEDTDG